METLKKAFKFMLVIVGAGLGLCIVTGLAVAMLVVAMKQMPDEDLNFSQIKTDHAVGVVELTGEIMSSDKFEKSLKQQLDSKKIKAVVVRIDSPGGAVGASEEIYRAIKTANEKENGKPVVCSLGTVAASGGLFAAAGCKKIIANRSTLTGSIGVIMMSPNVRSLMDRFGVQMTIVKSGKLKDTGSPFREVTTEDREYLQSLIDKSYVQFVNVVADSRNIPVAEVKKFADGRIILGEEAKELKLIDEIGSLGTAAKIALSLTGDQSEPEIIKPQKASGLMAYLGETSESSLFYWFKSFNKTQLLYQSFIE